MCNLPNEDQPIIERLRQALNDLDSIEGVLKDIDDSFFDNDAAGFQLKNVNRIRSFISKELNSRERVLLWRFQSVS